MRQSIIFSPKVLALEVLMINLAAGKCVACRAGELTLTDPEIEDLLLHVHGWEVKEVNGMKRLEKVFKFKNFAQALEFTNKVGAIAEEENHHPLIITEYGRIRLAACTGTISSWLQRLMSCLSRCN